MNKKYTYNIGDIFGAKKIIDLYKVDNHLVAEVECVLCGKRSVTRPYQLYNKINQSCICTLKTKNGLSNSRIYKIYTNMKSRCFTESDKGYALYGGKGISICEEWLGENGFLNFYQWAIDNGYSDNLTIDRIDNTENYSPDNCQWITKSENTARANKTCQHRRSNYGAYYIILPTKLFFVFDNANQFVRDNKNIAEEYNLTSAYIRKVARNNKIYGRKEYVTKLGCKIGYVCDLPLSNEDLNRLSKTPLINGRVSRVHAA